MDETTRLRLAVLASRHGTSRLTARVRQFGVSAFTDMLSEISRADLEHADDEAAALADRGVGAILLGSPEYPHLLSCIRAAPPSLFLLGARDLLSSRGIGIC